MRIMLLLTALALFAWVRVPAQDSAFIYRNGDRLMNGASPFYFLGANAYYLMEDAAHGDTTAVARVLDMASSLGFTVLRTWAFFDSPDSTNPAVLQYRPGRFNESALRALDLVIAGAGQRGLRLVLPLVNSWDDYGGMNQYVRWRLQSTPALPSIEPSGASGAVITGAHGRSYRVQLANGMGHDDFYTDPVIRSWYRNYTGMLINRVNTRTGIRYGDDPTIIGWELANEPRSSDRTAAVVTTWCTEMSAYVKSLDRRHLVGTGEEGLDISPSGYSAEAYGQPWLLDGTGGVSYTTSLALPDVDFACAHFYPDLWGLSGSAGSEWISDHLRLARIAGKPFVLGEFAIRTISAPAYDTWLSMLLLDGGAGALVWQLVDSPERDQSGFGIACPGNGNLCAILQRQASAFNSRSSGEPAPIPLRISLLPPYPSPASSVAVISYLLPGDADVTLTLFSITGQEVEELAHGRQSAGERKVLLDCRSLASGAYIVRLLASGWDASTRMIVLH